MSDQYYFNLSEKPVSTFAELIVVEYLSKLGFSSERVKEILAEKKNPWRKVNE